VDRVSLKSFKRDYVAGAELAREERSSSRAVRRRLERMGVRPAFEIRTHRCLIYRRDELDRSEPGS
jgi:hypothetical protein